MIAAVKPTRLGIAAVEQYLQEKPVYLGKKLWTPNELEVGVMVCTATPNKWTMLTELVHRLGEVDLDERDSKRSLAETISRLSHDQLLDQFKEIEDTTRLNVEVGQWSFIIEWRALERQLKTNKSTLQKDLMWKGEVIVKGQPDIKVRL